MTEASASFQLKVNAGSYQPAGDPVDAVEGDTVTARLVTVEGINGAFISWTVFGTHGGAAPALTLAGSPNGQEVSFTVPSALAPEGGAYGLQSDVNGGFLVTLKSATTSKSAVYVLNNAGVRPFFFGETTEADSVYGVVPRLNTMAAVGTAGDYKESVRATTAGSLAANTRTGSVSTADANGALTAIDGVTLIAGERFLYRHASPSADNGIWVVTDVGDGSNPFVLTRASDFDEDAEVTAGCLIPVSEGTAYANQLWSLSSNDPIVVNSTSLTFTSQGSGISGTGTDERLVRWDGTGDIQDSGVLLNDSDEMSGLVQLSMGGTPATTGDIRWTNNTQIYGRNAADNQDSLLFTYDNNNNLGIGNNSTTAISSVQLTAPSVANAGVRINCTYFGFSEDTATPTFNISEENDNVASSTLLMHGQDNVFASSTGGNFHLRPGVGTSANGEIELQTAAGVPSVIVASNGNVTIDGASNILFNYGGTGSNGLSFSNNTIGLNGTGNYKIAQIAHGGSSVTAATFTIGAQNVTGVGSTNTGGPLLAQAGDASGAPSDNIGGVATFRGGDATNGTVSNTGGDVVIRAGIGATAGGVLRLKDSDGSTDRLLINANGSMGLVAASSLDFTVAGIAMSISGTAITVIKGSVDFSASVVTPEITQLDDNTNSITGDTFLMHAQDCGGTTSTGGSFHFRPGTGTSLDGSLQLQDAGTTPRVTVNPTTTVLDASSQVQLQVGASSKLVINSTSYSFFSGTLEFASTAVDTLVKGTDANGGLTGRSFVIRAGNVLTGTPSGARTGGDFSSQAADVTGGTTSNVAGDWIARAGLATGTSPTSGTLRLQDPSDTSVIEIDDTGLGLFTATPVAQPAGTGETTGFVANSGTGVNDDSTFTGNIGSTAYRINDIVKALKQLGALAQ